MSKYENAENHTVVVDAGTARTAAALHADSWDPNMFSVIKNTSRKDSGVNELPVFTIEFKDDKGKSEIAPSKASDAITGRTEQTRNELASSDSATRMNAMRSEIVRLKQMPTRTAADIAELPRLERAHFLELKNNSLEAAKLPVEQRAPLDKVNSDAVKFIVSQLKSDAKVAGTTGGGSGGMATQALVLRMAQDEMRKPMKAFSGRTPADLGYELIGLKSGSAMDDMGADFLLVNNRTGKFIMIDATQRNKGEVPNELPELRMKGVIKSDPHDPKFDSYEEGSPEYNAARREDVHKQFNAVFESVGRSDWPLKLSEVDLSTAGRAGGRSTDARKSVDRLETFDDKSKAAAIPSLKEELKVRRESLEQIVRDLKDKSEALRVEAASSPNDKVKQERAAQAEKVAKLADHTTFKPIYHVQRLEEKLKRIEDRLPEQYKRTENPDHKSVSRLKTLIEGEDFRLVGKDGSIDRMQVDKAFRTLLGQTPEQNKAEREAITNLHERYKANDAKAVDAVHCALGVDGIKPAEQRHDVPRPQEAAQKEKLLEAVKQIKAAAESNHSAEHVSGVHNSISGALKKRGVGETTSKGLAEELLSGDEHRFRDALEKIDKEPSFRRPGALKGFMEELRGLGGTAAMVAITALAIYAGSGYSEEAPSKPATWK